VGEVQERECFVTRFVSYSSTLDTTYFLNTDVNVKEQPFKVEPSRKLGMNEDESAEIDHQPDPSPYDQQTPLPPRQSE